MTVPAPRNDAETVREALDELMRCSLTYTSVPEDGLAALSRLVEAAEQAQRERDEAIEAMMMAVRARDGCAEALMPFVTLLNPKALMQGDGWEERFDGYIADAKAALSADMIHLGQATLLRHLAAESRLRTAETALRELWDYTLRLEQVFAPFAATRSYARFPDAEEGLKHRVEGVLGAAEVLE